MGVFRSESAAGAVPQESSHCFLRQGLSVVWETLTQQGVLARKPQEPVCFPQSAGITSACHHAWLALHGFLEGQTQVLELYAQTLCWVSLSLSPRFLTIAILAEMRGNEKSL